MNDERPSAYVDPVDAHRLAVVVKEQTALVEVLSSLPCDSPEREVWFGNQLTDAQALLKRLEEERTAVTRPIDQEKKRIDARYKPAKDLIAKVKEIVSGKLAARRLEVAKAQEAARLTAGEAARAGDAEAVHSALATMPEQTAVAGTRTIWKWKWRLKDLAQVPDGYKTVNAELLNDMCADAKDDAAFDVPGIEFERVPVVAPAGRRK